jgi:hypothetical protein
LFLDEYRVEKGPAVGKDCPCDATAHIRRKGFPDDVHLLLVEGFGDFH